VFLEAGGSLKSYWSVSKIVGLPLICGLLKPWICACALYNYSLAASFKVGAFCSEKNESRWSVISSMITEHVIFRLFLNRDIFKFNWSKLILGSFFTTFAFF
jgi:hypothetical protein